jgi:hypothetical protein
MEMNLAMSLREDIYADTGNMETGDFSGEKGKKIWK